MNIKKSISAIETKRENPYDPISGHRKEIWGKIIKWLVISKTFSELEI